MTDDSNDVERMQLNRLCSKGKSSLRQKDVEDDGPYLVYGASGVVGRMSVYQNEHPYVAVVKDGAGVGRAMLCAGKTSVLGTMQALLPKEGTNLSYLLHLVRSLKLGEDYSGSTIPHIYFKDYGKRMVPVPMVSRQAAVAGILDSIGRLESSCDARCSKLDELVKSRFVEMFGDLEHNEAGWPVLKFDDFAIIDTHMTNDFAAIANVPHIGIDSIESNTGEITGYRTVAEDGVKSGKYPFTSKHIIYSKIRPALNKVALPTFSGVCSADAYPILPVEGICDRYFLAYVMRSHCFLKYILPLSGRAQMPKVNKDAIRNFTCPFPPFALQRQFADFVTHVDKLRAETQRQKQDLQTLYDSLAQEYFAM